MRALQASQWSDTPSDYGELVESMEYEVLAQADDDDYQGDSLYLLRDGQRYGVLTFGWGSCSGCDALQACSTMTEATELRDELHQSITWGSQEEIAGYLDVHDWAGDFIGDGLVREFLKVAKPALA